VLLLRCGASERPEQSRRAFAQQLNLQGGSNDQYQVAIAHAARDMPCLGRIVMQCDRWVHQRAAALGDSTQAVCTSGLQENTLVDLSLLLV
jgi:hypothetical protein